jgi:glycine/D-amino acid oxidase-like deaminating enzyme
MNREVYDYLIIGAGFFGVRLALFFAKHDKKVLIVDKEKSALTQASAINQSRIHNGYHYPRSLATGRASHSNYDRFLSEFADCAYGNFKHLYAVAKRRSKVTSYQFEQFCRQVDVPLQPLDKNRNTLFNWDTIENAYLVEEKAINLKKLQSKMAKAIECSNNITFVPNAEVDQIKVVEDQLQASCGSKTFTANNLFNVTYAGLNNIIKLLDKKALALKYELAEICLVKLPQDLTPYGFTVMDGSFFSCIPFPAQGCYSLTHVQYTPHKYWQSTEVTEDPYKVLKHDSKESNFIFMKNASSRYVPAIYDAQYQRSLYTIKAVLIRNEEDDARPILYYKHSEQPLIASVLGAKLDCIYELEATLEKELTL